MFPESKMTPFYHNTLVRQSFVSGIRFQMKLEMDQLCLLVEAILNQQNRSIK